MTPECFHPGARVRQRGVAGWYGTVMRRFSRAYADMTDRDVRVQWDDGGVSDERDADLEFGTLPEATS